MIRSATIVRQPSAADRIYFAARAISKPAGANPCATHSSIKPPQPRRAPSRPSVKCKFSRKYRVANSRSIPNASASARRNLRQMPHAPIARRRQEPPPTSRRIDARPRNPHRKHKRQPGPTTPDLAEVPDLTKCPGVHSRTSDSAVLDFRCSAPQSSAIARSPINSTASASVALQPAANRQRLPLRPHAAQFGQQNLRRAPRSSASPRRAPRAAPRPAARESAASRSAPARGTPRTHPTRSRNPAVRKNSTDGIKRHIQPPRRQRIGQPARQIKQQPHLRRKRLQAVHQRLAIQIIDGTNSHPNRIIRDSAVPSAHTACRYALAARSTTPQRAGLSLPKPAGFPAPCIAHPAPKIFL